MHRFISVKLIVVAEIHETTYSTIFADYEH